MIPDSVEGQPRASISATRGTRREAGRAPCPAVLASAPALTWFWRQKSRHGRPAEAHLAAALLVREEHEVFPVRLHVAGDVVRVPATASGTAVGPAAVDPPAESSPGLMSKDATAQARQEQAC